jgi:signal transduction histidine kinase
MLVRTKVWLTACTAAVVLCGVIGMLFWAAADLSASRHAEVRGHAVKNSTVAISLLAMEYLIRPSERIKQQWNAVHDEIASVLQTPVVSGESEELVSRIAKLNDTAANDFALIASREGSVSERVRQIQIGQFMAKAQLLTTLAERLVAATQHRRDRAAGILWFSIRLNVLAVLFIGIMTFTVIMPSILKPLRRLHAAIQAHRDDMSLDEEEWRQNDEFGAIGRDYFAMRQRLAESYAVVEQRAKELERSNQELDRFAYVASHDLKAPLRVIDNTSSWLEEDLKDSLTEKNLKYLRILRNRSQRMEKLLDDLLAYARIGRTKDDRHGEIITGSKLVGDILALLSPPPSFTVEVAPEFAAIRISRMPLQQVLYNLINNAIKHHDRDGGTIALNVERMPGTYRFTVRDDGPGIPQQYHQQIFEMFRTLKPRDEVEGSGMGLAIVKKTVEFLGGTIEIMSGNGRGTAFVFTWPSEVDEIISGEAA